MHITKTRIRRLSVVGAVMSAIAALTFTVALPAQAAMQTDDSNPTLVVNYDAEGTTHIGAGVNTDMHIGPTTLSSTMDLVTTDLVDGSLEIPSQQMTFSVLGIPTRATVTMDQVGPLTGTLALTDQRGKLKLDSHVAYDIQISNVQAQVFGIWWSLGIGSNCHTASPVDINASTPDGEFFTVNDGGHVTGTYSIGQFTGCTPLNFFDIPGFFPWFGSIPINAIVSGDNNTLDLQISNGRYGG